MRVDEFPPEGAVTSRVLPVVRTPEPTLEMKPRESASLVRQVPVHFGLERGRHIFQEGVHTMSDRLQGVTTLPVPIVPGEEHLPDEAVGVHSRHMAGPG